MKFTVKSTVQDHAFLALPEIRIEFETFSRREARSKFIRLEAEYDAAYSNGEYDFNTLLELVATREVNGKDVVLPNHRFTMSKKFDVRDYDEEEEDFEEECLDCGDENCDGDCAVEDDEDDEA